MLDFLPYIRVIPQLICRGLGAQKGNDAFDYAS
jgi:hypothetical protein